MWGLFATCYRACSRLSLSCLYKDASLVFVGFDLCRCCSHSFQLICAHSPQEATRGLRGRRKGSREETIPHSEVAGEAEVCFQKCDGNMGLDCRACLRFLRSWWYQDAAGVFVGCCWWLCCAHSFRHICSIPSGGHPGFEGPPEGYEGGEPFAHRGRGRGRGVYTASCLFACVPCP